MKPLIRRLSRVADSSCSNRICSSDFHQSSSSSVFLIKRATVTSTVPSGHVPVNVGDEMEMERFVVSAEQLNHPVFIGLLNRSAQEYGYAQKGVLHIPCNVFVFEQVVDTLQSGNTTALSELTALLSADHLSETTE